MTPKERNAYNAAKMKASRDRRTAQGLQPTTVWLTRDTLAALDRLKATHSTRQAAIEHAIRRAASHTATTATMTLRNDVELYAPAQVSAHNSIYDTAVINPDR